MGLLMNNKNQLKNEVMIDTVKDIRSKLKRPKVSIYIAASIDGYIAREDDDLDWLNTVADVNEDYGFENFMSQIDTIILGRKTYKVAIKAYKSSDWPYTNKKIIVLSKTLKTVIDEATLYSGDLVSLINLLYSEGTNHIWIDGGNTISQFLRLGMVDNMILSIIPILLGQGIRLFDLNQETPCRLSSSQSYPSGLVQLRYALS